MTLKNIKDSSVSPFLFLINPLSGTGKHTVLKSALRKIDKSNIEVVETKSAEHSAELVQQAIKEKRKCVVAAGGDGTANSIGSQLVYSEVSFGIIPTGSGNGIARHLKMAMNPKMALDQILTAKLKTIDTFSVNDKRAIGFAGLGFDGYVANRFNGHTSRGFWSYTKLTLKAFREYKATQFELDGLLSRQFSVVIANTSQFGNNAYINPTSIDNDGYIELILMDKPSILSSPVAAVRLFNKTLNKSYLVKTQQCKNALIKNVDRASLHIDGEPMGNPSELDIKVSPKSLNVITG